MEAVLNFENLIKVFTVAFVVIDPIGVGIIVANLTIHFSKKELRELALRTIAISTLVLLSFFFFGEGLFRLLDINFEAFKVGGGLLLLLVAYEMLHEKRIPRKEQRAQDMSSHSNAVSLAVTPISLPLIAGPATITAVMVQTREFAFLAGAINFSVFFANILLCGIFIYFSQQLMRAIGTSFAMIINRLLGIVLAAWAIDLILTGVKALWLSS